MHKRKGIISLVRILESNAYKRNACFGLYDYCAFSFIVPDISTLWMRMLLSLGQ